MKLTNLMQGFKYAILHQRMQSCWIFSSSIILKEKSERGYTHDTQQTSTKMRAYNLNDINQVKKLKVILYCDIISGHAPK